MQEAIEELKTNGLDHDLPPGRMRIELTDSLEGHYVVLNTNKINRKTMRELRKVYFEGGKLTEDLVGAPSPELFDKADEFESRILALVVPLIEKNDLPDKLEGDPKIWADEWPYHHVKDFYKQMIEKVGEFVNGPKKPTSMDSLTTSSATDPTVM